MVLTLDETNVEANRLMIETSMDLFIHAVIEEGQQNVIKAEIDEADRTEKVVDVEWVYFVGFK